MICPRCRQPLRLSQTPLPRGLQCLACGRSPEDCSRKHFQCAQCEGVVFCKQCRVCPAGHHLKRVASLVERSGKRYEKAFVCDLCATNCYALPAEGVFHCTACAWDCCADCDRRALR